MKKIILGLSLLALQVLAIQCTEKEYAPYFNSENKRYMYSYSQTSDSSVVVIDKKSIVYDKKNQKVMVWTIHQRIAEVNEGIRKIRWEFNLQNNMVRVLSSISFDCKKNIRYSDDNPAHWYSIHPNSGNEFMLKDLKEYLKIQ